MGFFNWEKKMLLWLVSPWFHPCSCCSHCLRLTSGPFRANVDKQLFACAHVFFSAPLSHTPALVHVSCGMWSAAGRQAVSFAVER